VTSVDDALRGVSRLAFDTAPLVYLIERHPVFGPVVREIVRRVDSGEVHGVTSVITLIEVLALPLKLGQADLAAAYRRFLSRSRNLSLLVIDSVVAERAALLRARHGLRTPDAVQLAVALEAGCQAFLTNDAGLGKVTELRVVLLLDMVP
jgi:predicted nucleic acid-binding protein